MKYRITINETLKSSRSCLIEYEGDMDELLDEVEADPMFNDDAQYALEKHGAKIVEYNHFSMSDIHDWEVDDLEYDEVENEAEETETEDDLY